MRDFSSIIRDKGIPWVRHWIQASHEWSKNFIDENGVVDFESLGREEFEFREALYNKDFSTNERAKYLWNEALKTHDRQAANGKKGGRPKKSPQDAPNGNAGVDMYDAGNGAASKSPTSCDQFTADGDIREDSRGRYAPPSCSPEDGIPAETAPSHGGSVASLEARQGQALVSRRTGGSSVRGMAKVAQPSVRSRAKNSRCPNSREEFHAFVADNQLHEGLAEEWYAMHEARGWVDSDGKPIKEWKGALYNYCTKTEQKRRTA